MWSHLRSTSTPSASDPRYTSPYKEGIFDGLVFNIQNPNRYDDREGDLARMRVKILSNGGTLASSPDLSEVDVILARLRPNTKWHHVVSIRRSHSPIRREILDKEGWALWRLVETFGALMDKTNSQIRPHGRKSRRLLRWEWVLDSLRQGNLVSMDGDYSKWEVRGRYDDTMRSSSSHFRSSPTRMGRRDQRSSPPATRANDGLPPLEEVIRMVQRARQPSPDYKSDRTISAEATPPTNRKDDDQSGLLCRRPFHGVSWGFNMNTFNLPRRHLPAVDNWRPSITSDSQRESSSVSSSNLPAPPTSSPPLTPPPPPPVSPFSSPLTPLSSLSPRYLVSDRQIGVEASSPDKFKDSGNYVQRHSCRLDEVELTDEDLEELLSDRGEEATESLKDSRSPIPIIDLTISDEDSDAESETSWTPVMQPRPAAQSAPTGSKNGSADLPMNKPVRIFCHGQREPLRFYIFESDPALKLVIERTGGGVLCNQPRDADIILIRHDTLPSLSNGEVRSLLNMGSSEPGSKKQQVLSPRWVYKCIAEEKLWPIGRHRRNSFSTSGSSATAAEMGVSAQPITQNAEQPQMTTDDDIHVGVEKVTTPPKIKRLKLVFKNPNLSHALDSDVHAVRSVSEGSENLKRRASLLSHPHTKRVCSVPPHSSSTVVHKKYSRSPPPAPSPEPMIVCLPSAHRPWIATNTTSTSNMAPSISQPEARQLEPPEPPLPSERRQYAKRTTQSVMLERIKVMALAFHQQKPGDTQHKILRDLARDHGGEYGSWAQMLRDRRGRSYKPLLQKELEKLRQRDETTSRGVIERTAVNEGDYNHTATGQELHRRVPQNDDPELDSTNKDRGVIETTYKEGVNDSQENHRGTENVNGGERTLDEQPGLDDPQSWGQYESEEGGLDEPSDVETEDDLPLALKVAVMKHPKK
ncbi:hypothetical protein IAR55_004197 [Kwoniella newhampshirensis]|uniref:BRCT domain-containing protein n=1 Tax=Kwoniella newhampshirensis TaxID=1651941 RepID=A0AAW0YYD6_9TREE